MYSKFTYKMLLNSVEFLDIISLVWLSFLDNEFLRDVKNNKILFKVFTIILIMNYIILIINEISILSLYY